MHSRILAPKLFTALVENEIEMEELVFWGSKADFSAVAVDDLVIVPKARYCYISAVTR